MMKAVTHNHWEPLARAVYTEDYSLCTATGSGSQSAGIETLMVQLRDQMQQGIFFRVEDNGVFIGCAITNLTRTKLLSYKIRFTRKEQETVFINFLNSLLYGAN